MKKKLFCGILAMCLILPLFAVPAGANALLGYFPLNYAFRLTSENGQPVVYLEARSNVDKAITAFETVLFPRDGTGNALQLDTTGENYENILARNVGLAKMGDTFKGKITLSEFPGMQDASMRLGKVHFADGSVWENTRPAYYEEANFEIGNAVTASGAYLIGTDRGVQLQSSGYSVYARDWYIWDDSQGWVWFSGEMNPTCYVWKPSAAVKLVINHNPDLYKVMNFTVQPYPRFNIVSRNTGQMHTSDETGAAFYMPAGEKAPFVFDLWDTTAAESRAWYIWNDETGAWAYFSAEQGPSCEIWSRGSKTIKLIHGGDEKTSIMYYFEVA